MLLTLWVVLSTAGLVTFLVGHLLGMHGVASIGAVMVMLVGGEVMLDDLQIKNGERIERNYTTVDNETVENETLVSNSYDRHSWTEEFASENAIGLGLFEVLIGMLLFYRQMEMLSEE